MQVTLSRRARRDLDEIWRYIPCKSGSQETADRIIDFLLKKLDMLHQTPRAGVTGPVTSRISFAAFQQANF